MNPQTHSPWRFCVAPMMDWSDTHCRYFWRLLSRRARLYTEMVTAPALLHGDRAFLLRYHPAEAPLALQLGGSGPGELARCAALAEDAGFAEVNLNCGCPSDRVQNGAFGACLMAEPERVADAVAAMGAATRLPITVKHRLGIDHLDSDEHLHRFVATVAAAGCQVFIVHARKAWLKGLSPKQNREVPPLQYHRVRALKEAFPHLTFVLNGGLKTMAECQAALEPSAAAPALDGVMLGRAAYQDPYLLAEVDGQLFGDPRPAPSREAVMDAFIVYARTQMASGVRLAAMTRHVLGLYAGRPGGRAFRRQLSEFAHRAGAELDVLETARQAPARFN